MKINLFAPKTEGNYVICPNISHNRAELRKAGIFNNCHLESRESAPGCVNVTFIAIPISSL